jgi:hypothetical protein
MRLIAGVAALLALAGCAATPAALSPPPVTRPVALVGFAFEVDWRADRAVARIIGPAVPTSPVARRSLARSAIEAATRCAVRPETLRERPDGVAARLDCSRTPLVET